MRGFNYVLYLLVLIFVTASLSEAKEIVKLEKTVVTATKTEVSLKDAPGAIIIITAKEIEAIPAGDILEIIREKAGIFLSGRTMGGRKTISIRGLENRHSLILIDGRRIAASDAVMGHSDFENTWVPIESIERIEIVKGPLSALYGSEAIGGVINIITRPITEKWTGGVKAGGGFLDSGDGGESGNYGLFAGGPLLKDRFGLSLSANYIRDEDIPDKDDDTISEIEGKEIFSFGSALVFTPSKDHEVKASYNFAHEDRWRDDSRRGNLYEGLYDLDRYMAGLGWKGTMGPTISNVKAYHSKIDKVSTNKYENGNKTNTPEKLTNDVIDAQTSFSVMKNLVTLGGEFREETLEAESMADDEDDATHSALFFQDELELFNRLLLTIGLRWDEHEFFGSQTSPRIYALYRFTEKINLKAGFGQAFNAPTIKQVSKNYHASTGPHEFFGNSDVEPEKSNNYEVGVNYFSDLIDAKIYYFHNEIDDLIVWDQFGSQGRTKLFKAENIDSARTRGVETEFEATLFSDFALSAGYTYLDAKDTENDERLTGKPRHTVGANLKYNWDEVGFSGCLRYQYISDQVFENDNDELESPPDYSLWHISLEKKFLKKYAIQFGVENIGDVRLADDSDLYPYEERGRFFYANLRANF